ncbi:Polyphosphate kinase 2 [Acidobacteriia bacterium SbA2]|nr:Polyphosphate kinase 2 [Acidobacteriia bacterium SbA2]
MASKTHSHRAAAKTAKQSFVAPTTAPPNAGAGLNNPELYINRELSLLEFQSRVLEEAADATNPLLERVKFLAILGSNLDEFFMVRVAALMKQVASGTAEVGLDGRPPSAQLELIREKVRQITKQAHELWRQDVQPSLEQQAISLVDLCCLADDERAALDAFFSQHVFPVLTPLAFDPGRPFPHISNRSLNLAVVVRDPKGEEHFARVKVPDILPQLVQITATPGDSETAAAAPKPFKFAWLEQLIAANLGLLFPGMEIVESSPFRVTRDAEVAIQELESDDLLETIEEAMRERRFLEVVRLEVAQKMPDKILEILTSQIGVNPQDVYRVNEPLGMDRFMEFYSLDRPDLKDKPFVPMTPASLGADCQGDLFSLIRQEEFLLHHPYDSFQPVVEFVRQAARDPNVLAIKMTLYRVGRNSPIVAALLDAVEHGKQVAVLIELKARFDEESNIEWARTLEDAGVHVVYGIAGMKVHSKIALVVRREGDVIRRYVHLGTGNYNPITARLYTDLALLTCNEHIAADATYFFNALTGYAARQEPQKLLVSPVNMREKLTEMIRREIEHQKAGRPARLIFKVNAIEDLDMIHLLYQASQAGVKVDMLARGICSLRPGVPGVSDNIRVISIVGRFLEHSRVYYFQNGGAEEIYLGSADLMHRNLSHRVEIIFPVESPRLLRRLKDILDIYLSDQAKARCLQPDGSYSRSSNHETPGAIGAQTSFIGLAPVEDPGGASGSSA